MRALVIGGTRFIGLAAVRQLHTRGHTVAVYNRGQTPVTLPEGVLHIRGENDDLANYAADFQPEVVLHNIVINESHARSLIETFPKVSWVMSSSMDVYGAYGRLIGLETGPAVQSLLDEDAPLREVWYPYRAQVEDESDIYYNYDKIPAERIVLEAGGVVLRLPMVYGENDRQNRLAALVQHMADNRRAIVMDAAYAAWRSTYGYVENVAAALVRACESARSRSDTPGRVYNVGDMMPTMLELAQMVKVVMNWPGRIAVFPSEDLPEPLRFPMAAQHHLNASTARIRRELGYKPIINVEESIRRTVLWQRDNLPEQDLHYDLQDELLQKYGI